MLAIGVELKRGAIVILSNELARWKLDTLIASDA
jgi:hypothetical protein